MNCQLCHKEMIIDKEQFERSGKKEWMCPVRIVRNPNNKNKRIDVSHFRITRDERHNHRIIFPGEYRVIENKEPGHELENTFNICIYTSTPKSTFGNYDFIMNIPVFEFKDEEHLLKKINNLIIFS
jgi:hypothetical protein